MLISFNHKLHRELNRLAPEGYDVFVTRREGTLFTLISCQDPDYFAPWTGFQSIMERFGY